MYAPVILYPYRLDVLKERGYLRPPGAAKPDPIDAQWAARDKVQDARNDMREACYVPAMTPVSARAVQVMR